MRTVTQPPFAKPQRAVFFSYLLMAWFIAGSLDALAAIFIISGGNGSSIFKFISSGIYAKNAFAGGHNMVLLGVALHYLIAFSFTVFFFMVSRYIALPKNIFVNAIVYGMFIYIVMNVVVMSLSNIHIPPRTALGVIKNASILIVCVALPIVYIKRLYDARYQPVSK